MFLKFLSVGWVLVTWYGHTGFLLGLFNKVLTLSQKGKLLLFVGHLISIIPHWNPCDRFSVAQETENGDLKRFKTEMYDCTEGGQGTIERVHWLLHYSLAAVSLHCIVEQHAVIVLTKKEWETESALATLPSPFSECENPFEYNSVGYYPISVCLKEESILSGFLMENLWQTCILCGIGNAVRL